MVKLLTLFPDQALATLWSFCLSTLIARNGGVEIFGIFSTIMAVYYLFSVPINATLIGVVSVDVAKLHKSRLKYISAAYFASRTTLIISAILSSCVAAALITRMQVEHQYALMILSAAYISANLFSDNSRRIIGLAGSNAFSVYASALRFMLLVIAAVASLLLLNHKAAAISIVVCAVIFTLIYQSALRIYAHRKLVPFRSYSLMAIALARQLRYGRWIMPSAVLAVSLDQILIIYAGIIGEINVAAGLRAATFLFGLLNPVMQVMEILLPTFSMKIVGKKPRVSQIYGVAACGFICSIFIASIIGFINADIWIPFLGDDYKKYSNLTYWSAAIFSCTFTRLFLLPYIKTRAPMSMFVSSLASVCVGIAIAMAGHTLDAAHILHALLAAAGTNLLISIYIIWKIHIYSL